MNNEPKPELEIEIEIDDIGTKLWYINGKRHREDGPAVIENGIKEWWLNNKQYTYDEWFDLLTPEQQINYLWDLNEE